MGEHKSLIPVLQFLTILYHMSRLTTVITHNPFRIKPSSVTSWATVSMAFLTHHYFDQQEHCSTG